VLLKCGEKMELLYTFPRRQLWRIWQPKLSKLSQHFFFDLVCELSDSTRSDLYSYSCISLPFCIICCCIIACRPCAEGFIKRKHPVHFTVHTQHKCNFIFSLPIVYFDFPNNLLWYWYLLCSWLVCVVVWERLRI
jgi:hypothetical protein